MTKSRGLSAYASSVAALFFAIPATAWSQQAPPADPSSQQLERVEITGSSIKRIDAETALPVQIITRDQIQKTGALDVEQLLQTIGSVASSGGIATASSSGATTGSISAVSIHGLKATRTLVLVNGRRVAPYGVGFTNDSVSVDVNSIPLAAIERVEVLKDGASSLYGSDAIAGVINFILRQDYKGAEATGSYGDTTQGGASFKKATGTFGVGDLSSDHYNVMVVASYQKEGSLFGSQRSFASSGINSFTGNDTSSGNTFPGNIASYDPTTGAIGATSNPSAPGCPGPYAISDPAFFPTTRCRFDPTPLVTLIPASDRASLFATAKYAITPEISAYAEGSYNRNTTHVVIQPNPLSDQFAIPSTNVLCNQAPYNATQSGPCQAAIVLQPSSPFYPTAYATAQYGGTPDLVVRYRDALNGNRDFTDISEAPRAVLGVKGTALDWDFDVAGLYTESKVRERVNSGYPLYSQLLPLLNGGTVNFFGPNSAAVESEALADSFVGDAFSVKSSLTSISAKISKDVFQLPAGPLGFAAGLEGRKEKYDYTPSVAVETGDVAGYGGNFLPLDKSRNVGAVFSEVNVPIVKNLEADLAVRYDRYQTVGGSTTPKGSLRYQPVPQALFRTSYGEGFRAPSLQDLYAADTQGVSPNGLSDAKRCSPPVGTAPPGNNSSTDCLTQFPVTFGGNSALKPEKSKNFTLGTVLEPTNTLSVGIDYFRVRLDNTIVNGVVASTIVANEDQFSQLIVRGPSTGNGLPGPITNILQTNLNLGTTKVSGFDFDLKWRIPTTDWGRFTVSGSATYMNRYDTENLDGSYTGQVDQPNTVDGGMIPRFKSYLSANWTRGPFDLTFAQNFQKAYNDEAGDETGAPRRVRDYVTYDFQGTYAMFKSWKFTLGARNIFNTNPPYTNVGGSTVFQGGYDPNYADPRGRFIYGQVTYTLQ